MKFLSFLIATFAVVAVAQANDCYAPWGNTVLDNSSVIAYRDDNPPAGQRCEKEWRSCSNGYLSGYYQYKNCREDMGCQTSFGYIPNYGSIRAYRYPSAPRREKCQSEMRFCNNGRFSGSYSYSHCYNQ